MSRVADPKSKISLLRAAEEVFAERGLVNAKVEEIARRAGLSKGAFYLHFESKEAALKQVVESFLARCGAFFVSPETYGDIPTNPGQLLDFCLERDTQIFEFLWQNRMILRILPTCQGTYDYLVRAFHADMVERTREWVELFRREGIYRADVDVDLAATLMVGAYDALVARMIEPERRPPIEDWIEFAQTAFVRAFGAPEIVRVLEDRNPRVSIDIGAERAPNRGRRPSTERGRD